MAMTRDEKIDFHLKMARTSCVQLQSVSEAGGAIDPVVLNTLLSLTAATSLIAESLANLRQDVASD